MTNGTQSDACPTDDQVFDIFLSRQHSVVEIDHELFFYSHSLPSTDSARHHETYLYNFDPLKPQFYIVKLGFTGVYIIFLISAQKHRLWYSLEPPR